ncbi:hypothetical protein ES708_04089 [subsurface metagenome]
MRKVLIGVLAIVTVALLVMAVWTGTIDRSMDDSIGREDYATKSFEFNSGVPISGAITIGSPPEMLESKLTSITYNISMEIPYGTPMDLRVNEIHFFFTPPGFADNPSIELMESVGGLWSYNGILEVVNASSIIMRGHLKINPEMPQEAETESGFLGCTIDFNYWEHGLPEPNNSSGEVGVLQMRPVTLIPAHIPAETWILALGTSLLGWGVLIVYIIRKRGN